MSHSTETLAAPSASFARRPGVVWFDGAFVPWADARVHVLSHAMHYGTAVFEGERVYGGRVFALERHTQRLLDSAALLGMTVPFSHAQLTAATQELIARQRIDDGYVRPIVWRGAEDMGIAGRGTAVHAAIATWEWPNVFAADARERGIRIAVSDWVRPAPNSAPVQAKASGLYLLCALSRSAAEAAGYDDALMLDYRGLVAEATGANVFFVAGGQLVTPLADTFLNGITRQTVIALARELGLTVTERHVALDELLAADEVFLTGTAYEVQPVQSIDARTFTVGDVTRKLMAAYTAAVRAS